MNAIAEDMNIKIEYFMRDSAKSMNENIQQNNIVMHPEKFILVTAIITSIIIFVYFYTIKLKQKEQLLLEQNKAKERFLSDMSHEMRTPLSAIIGLDDILLKELESKEQMDYALKIRDSSNHLLGLMNDILDLSKISQGKLTIEDKEFDLNKTLMNMDVIYRITAQNKNLTFNTDFPKQIEYMLIGDELRLKQVIINLLSNAIKYNKMNGTVWFLAEVSEETESSISLLFTIKDTGYGIKKKNKKKIFEAFEREGRIENVQGTGLGLSISKKIAELMGGSLTFESQEGVGSTFMYQLRLKKGNTVGDSYSKEEEEEKPDLSGYRVLLVEDNEINAMICEKLLLSCNALVDIAQNGEIACEKFADSRLGYYKIILMDIRMPVMNGIEASERIRSMQRPDTKNLIMIALSANAYETDCERSKEAGMDAHLAKPIKQKELYNTINKLLNILMN